MFVGNWIVRFKALSIYSGTVAGVIISHLNLLHASPKVNDLIEIVCLIVLALNKPVASQMEERK